MHRLMTSMTLEPSEYIELKECFQGGFTHANAHRVQKLCMKVGSFDFTSSYPAVMVAEKFPISKGRFLGLVELNYILDNIDTNGYMFRLKIWDLAPKIDCDHPISFSKCRHASLKDELLDNGRIIYAEYLETTCTEQDLLTYMEFYSWTKIEIYDCYEYTKQYLPRPFVETIFKLYKDKTELKDVEGREVDYMIAKAMLNALYGMTVTDIVREELFYDDSHVDQDNRSMPFYSNYDEMEKLSPEEQKKAEEAFLVEQITRYNNNPYRFLFYVWGVWVTAYARRNLFSGIKHCNKDYIYADTDSIKILNPEKHMSYIEDYNAQITEKLKQACEFHEFDFSLTKPKNIHGEEKPLGVWEFEGIYDEFMTLGAKRYMWLKDDRWNLTVAGVNKKSGMNYLLKRAKEENKSPFDFFNMDLIFPATDSGRNVLTYIDTPMSGTITDYYGIVAEYEELSGIHMESTDYSLNPMKNFLDYLFMIKDESW